MCSILPKKTILNLPIFNKKNSYSFCLISIKIRHKLWGSMDGTKVIWYLSTVSSQKGSMPILMQNSVCGLLSKFISPLISCFKFCLFVVGIWHFILFSSLLNQRQYQLKVIMNGIYETQYLMIAELLIHFYYPSFICPILLTVWQWVKIIFEVAFLF